MPRVAKVRMGQHLPQQVRVPVAGESPIRFLWRVAILDAAQLCRDRHDVSESTTARHRRPERGARVRQSLIGERVKGLLTKDVDNPRILNVETYLVRKQEQE